MATARTLTLTDFLLARIAEAEADATPHTVVISGGRPAPTIPNCIGPWHSGDCPERWSLGDIGGDPTLAVDAAIREHEMTHASAAQQRVLAESAAKRAIVERCSHVGALMPSEHLARGVLRILASVYADHPDYDSDWRP